MSDNPLSRLLGPAAGPRRFVWLGAAAAGVLAIWLVGKWAATPTYVTLYHDLDLKEAGAMSEQLAKNGLPYRLGGGGTEVQVPASEIARARVMLARDGMPSSGRPGLELFDKPSWGMTDFTQKVTYQRALEGELARTVGTMRGVERAQVHLLLPNASPVRRLDHAAGASVVLTLKPGMSLTPEAVQGITYVVSNSVEQLSPENVAVMDDAGHVLSVPASAGGGTGLTTRQLSVQHGMEEGYASKIEELLGTVVGPGRVRAEVTARVSFDQVDRTVEKYDPDGQVLQTEQRSEGAAGGSDNQTIVSNQYQNSRQVEKTEGAVGTLQQLTVAVLVDQRVVGAGAGALSLVQLDGMVRNAIGADSTRGDRVSVMAVPFDTTIAAAALAATGGNAAPKTDPLVVAERFSHPAIGLIAIAAMIVLVLQAIRLAGAAPATTLAAAGERAELAPAEAPAQLRAGLNGDAQRPDTAAQVLRAWLAEDDD